MTRVGLRIWRKIQGSEEWKLGFLITILRNMCYSILVFKTDVVGMW